MSNASIIHVVGLLKYVGGWIVIKEVFKDRLCLTFNFLVVVHV